MVKVVFISCELKDEFGCNKLSSFYFHCEARL